MLWTATFCNHYQLSLYPQRSGADQKYWYWKVTQLQNARKIPRPPNRDFAQQRRHVHCSGAQWSGIQPSYSRIQSHPLFCMPKYSYPSTQRTHWHLCPPPSWTRRFYFHRSWWRKMKTPHPMTTPLPTKIVTMKTEGSLNFSWEGATWPNFHISAFLHIKLCIPHIPQFKSTCSHLLPSHFVPIPNL